MSFTCINSINPHNNSEKQKLLLFYFTDEITEAEKSSITFLKSHSWRVVETESEPQKSYFGFHALKYYAVLPLLFASITNQGLRFGDI